MSVSIIEINTEKKKLQREGKLVFKPHGKAQMSFPYFPNMRRKFCLPIGKKKNLKGKKTFSIQRHFLLC